MGWGMKIGLFLFALIVAAFGAWIIAIPIVVLLFVPPMMNGRGRRKVAVGGAATNATPSKSGHGWIADVLGAMLVLLSVVAFFSGGVFSPVVLLGLGLVILLRHRISIRVSGSVGPVDDSILLRFRVMPFRWYAAAEAKVSTRDVEGALSGVSKRILYVADPTPKIFLFFCAVSLRRATAEQTLLRRMQVAARQLTPLGVYLLPLSSEEAAKAATIRASEIDAKAKNLRQFVASSDFGAVALEAQQGFVTKFDLYGRPDQAEKARSLLSGKKRDAGLLTLREFLHEARQKLGSPQPDRYVAFLSSMAATEGENLGQRITQATQGEQEQVLLVASVGSPPVKLTRAQLHAISTIYE